MQSMSKPRVSHFAIVFLLLVSACCGVGWFAQAGRLREAEHKLALSEGEIRVLQEANREFAGRQQSMMAEISTLKERFDAGQVALVELDKFFNQVWEQRLNQEGDPDDVVTDPAPEPALALPITVAADGDGQVSSLSVGLAKLFDGPLDQSRLKSFDRRLSDVFAIEGKPFGTFVFRIGGSLRFDELLKLLVVCSRQKTTDGMVVNKIGFVQLPAE